MALIVGHSHVKYFKDYVFDDKIDCLSYSGSKIEELWEKIEDNVHTYKVIAVHTGANNIPRDGADAVLEKFEDLCGKILQANPSCRIVLSAILPRVQSGYDNNRRSEDFLNRFNNIANEVNQTLRRATQSMDRITFVEFPRYIVQGEIQRHLLSKDGLHLSFEGTEYVVSTIEDQIFRTLWDLNKIVC